MPSAWLVSWNKQKLPGGHVGTRAKCMNVELGLGYPSGPATASACLCKEVGKLLTLFPSSPPQAWARGTLLSR